MNGKDKKPFPFGSEEELAAQSFEDGLAMVYGMKAGGLLDPDMVPDEEEIALALAREAELKNRFRRY